MKRTHNDSLELDTEVFISGKCRRYHGNYNFKRGKVTRFYDRFVGVRIDNAINRSSQYGVFWFEKGDLRVIPSIKPNENKTDYNIDFNGGNNMMTKQDFDAFDENDYKVAVVKFLEGFNTYKEYNFKVYPDLYNSLAEGDCCLVHGKTDSFTVVKVIKIVDKAEANYNATSELICKVNLDQYQFRKEVRSRDRRKKKLISDMCKTATETSIVNSEESIALFELLGKFNPDLAKLVDTYRSL